MSPAGELTLGSIDDKICLCDWAIENRRNLIDRRVSRYFNAIYENGTSEIIAQAITQLKEYFLGNRIGFSLPVAYAGTEFQQMVWAQLLKIHYGDTISYAEMATRIGRPKAVRAVGLACAANPISIIIPCHRVTSSNGRLTGYAGGLSAKQFLINLEQTSGR